MRTPLSCMVRRDEQCQFNVGLDGHDQNTTRRRERAVITVWTHKEPDADALFSVGAVVYLTAYALS